LAVLQAVILDRRDPAGIVERDGDDRLLVGVDAEERELLWRLAEVVPGLVAEGRDGRWTAQQTQHILLALCRNLELLHCPGRRDMPAHVVDRAAGGSTEDDCERGSPAAESRARTWILH